MSSQYRQVHFFGSFFLVFFWQVYLSPVILTGSHFLLFPPCWGRIFVWPRSGFESKRGGRRAGRASHLLGSPGAGPTFSRCPLHATQPPGGFLSLAEQSDFGRDVCIRVMQVARPVPEPRGAVPAAESSGLLGLEALCTEEQKTGRFLREDSENCRGMQTTFWSALCPHECSLVCFNPTPPCYTFGQYLEACLGKHQEHSGLFAAGNLTPPKCVTMNRIWPE